MGSRSTEVFSLPYNWQQSINDKKKSMYTKERKKLKCYKE